MIWTAHWFEHQDDKRMLSCVMKLCLFVQQTNKKTCTPRLMHSTVVLYFSGHLSIMFEFLTFVRDVVRLTKADTMPPLQLQELRKFVHRRLPIMYARSIDSLTHDYQPSPKLQTLSYSPEYSAPRNVLVDGSGWLLLMRNGLLRISALQFFTKVSLFHCNSLTPCRNEVLAALWQSHCFEHTRQRSCPSSTRQI